MAATGITVPLMVQVTIETTGPHARGQRDGRAALTALEAMRPDVIGLNCATGPNEMTEHLRYLSPHAAHIPLALPNAGLPSVVDGHTHYDLTPEQLADAHERNVSECGVNIVGGCCGTTPAHLKAVVDRIGSVAGASPRRALRFRPGMQLDLLARAVPPGAGVPRGRRAHERQWFQGLSRGDARRRLGHLRPYGRDQVRRVRTSSTCASTTWGATAPSTWTRSRLASPPRQACRSCLTAPSRRWWRPACSTMAARRS